MKHPDKGKSCCTSTQDYGIDLRCQYRTKGGGTGGRSQDVNSKEMNSGHRGKSS